MLGKSSRLSVHLHSIHRAIGVTVLSVGLVATAPVAVAELTDPTAWPADCGPAGPISGKDVRLRSTDQVLQWEYDDNWKYHVQPAIDRLRKGELSPRTKNGLDWTLIRFPNHSEVLRLLILYDLAGGKRYDKLPTECYFARAKKFAPDDMNVLMAEAYWRWKKGEQATAKALYEKVISVDPQSAEAHYNLGLLHCDRGEFATANEHAQVAYANGYPLPGLRNKLKQSGYWRPPAPTAEPNPPDR